MGIVLELAVPLTALRATGQREFARLASASVLATGACGTANFTGEQRKCSGDAGFLGRYTRSLIMDVMLTCAFPPRANCPLGVLSRTL